MQTKKTILVLAERSEQIKKQLQTQFADRCELLFAENLDNLDGALARADGIIGEPEKEQLQQAKRLSWLQLTWAGADKYAKMEDFPEGVTLTNASGAFGVVISEYVIGSVIALYRALPVYWSNQAKRLWQQNPAAQTIFGKRALILGMGDLGGNLARRLQAFGAHVTGLRRMARAEIPAGFDEADTMEALDAQLPLADLVVNCLPGTGETAGLMTKERLLRMKRGALFVNVGRGSLVRTEDLADALQSGHLGGAMLDVFETEPLAERSPLWEMGNVLITPHIAGPSFQGNTDVQEAIWSLCAQNLERYLEEKPLHHVVNRRAGY